MPNVSVLSKNVKKHSEITNLLFSGTDFVSILVLAIPSAVFTCSAGALKDAKLLRRMAKGLAESNEACDFWLDIDC